MPYTVLIVDDDLRLRASMAQAIRGASDFKLVGEADDLPEGLRLVEAMQPDVLLVDIGLPSGSGLERSKAPMLSNPKKPPENKLRPSGSFRLIHQVKFNSNFKKHSTRKLTSRSPRTPVIL